MCSAPRTAGGAGAVSVKEALVLGAVLSLLAFGLVLTTNPPAILLSFAALAVAIAYPFAKRVLAMPQAVLGVAFSFGIPMAFAAAPGRHGVEPAARVPLSAWALLVANLFWVLAYDTEYAMVDRDDDLQIGVRSSAIALGRWDVPAIMIFYATYLTCGQASACAGLGRWFLLGIVAAAAQALWHYTLIRRRHRAKAASRPFGPTTGSALRSLPGPSSISP